LAHLPENNQREFLSFLNFFEQKYSFSSIRDQIKNHSFHFHPRLFDAAIHAIAAISSGLHILPEGPSCC
jgi:hypothetical protein